MLLIEVCSVGLLGATPAFLPLETLRFYLLLFVVSPYTEVALSVEHPQSNAIHKWLPKKIVVTENRFRLSRVTSLDGKRIASTVKNARIRLFRRSNLNAE